MGLILLNYDNCASEIAKNKLNIYKNSFCFRGLRPLNPHQGSASGPRWGTPIIGSRYCARHWHMTTTYFTTTPLPTYIPLWARYITLWATCIPLWVRYTPLWARCIPFWATYVTRYMTLWVKYKTLSITYNPLFDRHICMSKIHTPMNEIHDPLSNIRTPTSKISLSYIRLFAENRDDESHHYTKHLVS